MAVLEMVPEAGACVSQPPKRLPARNTGVMPVPSSWKHIADEQMSRNAMAQKLGHAKSKSTLSNNGPAVKRWDGMHRRTQPWDGLRRDSELWFPDGDCYIYLCAKGHSQRGPSFRVDFRTIVALRCEPMLDRYLVPEDAVSSSVDIPTVPSGDTTRSRHIDLYIPAPKNLDRDEAFRFHMTTRNFIAWLFGKAIVGRHLGGALVDLLERMKHFRSVESLNVKDIVQYMDETGYSDFRNCANHALAGLFFAEHCEVVHLWRDAFVHCVGMNDRLIFSPEFEYINRTSKALISRAKLEMDLRMDHAGQSLGTFLEDEMSPQRLHLSAPARAHLDHFRSFLHSFYVLQYGYWPPAPMTKTNQTFSKQTYRSMYFEFRSLYQYLVDSSTTASSLENQPTATGLDIASAISSFDSKHHYQTLPHPLPLLPREVEIPQPKKPAGAFGAVSSFLFGAREDKTDKRVATIAFLERAANQDIARESKEHLVRAYMDFERDSTMSEEEKIPAADARRVRWLLIYGVLQTLISVTRAPTEVSDTEGVSYSLCCQTAGTPPWMTFAGKQESSAPSHPLAFTEAPTVETQLRDSTAIAPSSPSAPEFTLQHLTSFHERSIDADEFGVLKNTKYGPRHVSLHSRQLHRQCFSEILVPGYGNGTSADETPPLSREDPSRSSTASEEGPSTPDLASPASSSEDGDGFREREPEPEPEPVSDPDSKAAAAAAAAELDLQRLSVASSWYGDERDDIFPRALKISKHDVREPGLDGSLDELERMHEELERYVLS